MSVLLFFVFSFRSSYIGLDLGFTGVRVGGWKVERLVLFVTRHTFQVNIRVPSRVLNVIWAIPKSSLKYFLKVKVKSLSRVRLFATWGTAAHQAPPSMGFSRQEYWSGLPFLSPGDLPDPGIEPRSPALQADAGRRFNLWTTRYIIHIPYSCTLRCTIQWVLIYSKGCATITIISVQFSSVQLLSHVRLFVTPWIAAHQASMAITNSWSLLKLTSIESVMPSNHLIFCRPLLLLPSVFPNIRVFSSQSVLHIKWPNYWCFSFSISPCNEYSGLVSFRMDWLDLLAVQGTLKSLLQHHSSKASILWYSAFFIVQLSHPIWLMEKP